MENKELPHWILDLEKEDFKFIQKFIVFSGSLKALSKEYDVSYPTVRIRLDTLIQKINLSIQNESEDSFITLIKNLAIDNQISLDTAKLIIQKYQCKE